MNLKTLMIGAALSTVAALAAVPAAAGTTVGVTDGANCYPFNCNDSGTSTGQSIDYQQLYSSSAFSGPITFSTISFFDTQYPGTQVLSGNYDITFGTTTAAVNSNGPFTLTNVQTFFNGSLPAGGTSSRYSITGSSYTYNPTAGNLVMEVVATNQANSPNGTNPWYFDADYTGTVTSRYFSVTNGVTSSSSGGLVTEFGASGVPEPASWAFMLAGFGLTGAALRRRPAKALAA